MKKIKFLFLFIILVSLSGCGQKNSSVPKYKSSSINECTKSCSVEKYELFNLELHFSNPSKKNIVSVTLDDVKYTPKDDGETKSNLIIIELYHSTSGKKSHTINKFEFADKDGIIKEVFVNKKTVEYEVVGDYGSSESTDANTSSIESAIIEGCNTAICQFWEQEDYTLKIKLRNPKHYEVKAIVMGSRTYENFQVNDSQDEVILNLKAVVDNSHNITGIKYYYESIDKTITVKTNYDLSKMVVTPIEYKPLLPGKAKEVTNLCSNLTCSNLSKYDMNTLYKFTLNDDSIYYGMRVLPSTINISNFVTVVDAASKKFKGLNDFYYHSSYTSFQQYEEIYKPYFNNLDVFAEFNSVSVFDNTYDLNMLENITKYVDKSFIKVVSYLLDSNYISYADNIFNGTYTIEEETGNNYTAINTYEEFSTLIETEGTYLLYNSHFDDEDTEKAVNDYVAKYRQKVYKVSTYFLTDYFTYTELGGHTYNHLLLIHNGQIITSLDEYYGYLLEDIGSASIIYRFFTKDLLSA